MRMHYLLPTHLVQRRNGGFSKRLRVGVRTGNTIRWPSFTQYDSAYIEVLLGNELFGQAEWTAKESDGGFTELGSAFNHIKSTQVDLKVQRPTSAPNRDVLMPLGKLLPSTAAVPMIESQFFSATASPYGANQAQ